MTDNLVYSDESYAINGACMEVYKTLGCGFLELVYQECLCLEFKKRGIPFTPQRPLALAYKGTTLRQRYTPDFVCYGKIIVELKAVSELVDEHKRQVSNYLKATSFQLGLLYNFGHYPLLEKVRVVNTQNNPLTFS